MKKLTAFAALCAALVLTVSSAEARSRHYHHASYHHRYFASQRPAFGQPYGFGDWGASYAPAREGGHRWGAQRSPRFGYETAQSGYGDRSYASKGGDPRPAQWCGWYLRQVFGIADKTYNLARAWLHLGTPSGPEPGAVAIGPHHVAKLISHVAGTRWIIEDGNDGPVRVHVSDIGRWAHWFRRV